MMFARSSWRPRPKHSVSEPEFDMVPDWTWSGWSRSLKVEDDRKFIKENLRNLRERLVWDPRFERSPRQKRFSDVQIPSFSRRTFLQWSRNIAGTRGRWTKSSRVGWGSKQVLSCKDRSTRKNNSFRRCRKRTVTESWSFFAWRQRSYDIRRKRIEEYSTRLSFEVTEVYITSKCVQRSRSVVRFLLYCVRKGRESRTSVFFTILWKYICSNIVMKLFFRVLRSISHLKSTWTRHIRNWRDDMMNHIWTSSRSYVHLTRNVTSVVGNVFSLTTSGKLHRVVRISDWISSSSLQFPVDELHDLRVCVLLTVIRSLQLFSTGLSCNIRLTDIVSIWDRTNVQHLKCLSRRFRFDNYCVNHVVFADLLGKKTAIVLTRNCRRSFCRKRTLAVFSRRSTPSSFDRVLNSKQFLYRQKTSFWQFSVSDETLPSVSTSTTCLTVSSRIESRPHSVARRWWRLGGTLQQCRRDVPKKTVRMSVVCRECTVSS